MMLIGQWILLVIITDSHIIIRTGSDIPCQSLPGKG
jgi:hypothetical protein